LCNYAKVNNADDVRQIVLDIRSIILGEKVKELKFSEIVYFPLNKKKIERSN